VPEITGGEKGVYRFLLDDAGAGEGKRSNMLISTGVSKDKVRNHRQPDQFTSKSGGKREEGSGKSLKQNTSGGNYIYKGASFQTGSVH